MDKELLESLRKKAIGGEYIEESLEYERDKVGDFLYCENLGRLYVGAGFLKVKKTQLKSSSELVFCEKPFKFHVPHLVIGLLRGKTRNKLKTGRTNNEY